MFSVLGLFKLDGFELLFRLVDNYTQFSEKKFSLCLGMHAQSCTSFSAPALALLACDSGGHPLHKVDLPLIQRYIVGAGVVSERGDPRSSQWKYIVYNARYVLLNEFCFLNSRNLLLLDMDGWMLEYMCYETNVE